MNSRLSNVHPTLLSSSLIVYLCCGLDTETQVKVNWIPETEAFHSYLLRIQDTFCMTFTCAESFSISFQQKHIPARSDDVCELSRSRSGQWGETEQHLKVVSLIVHRADWSSLLLHTLCFSFTFQKNGEHLYLFNKTYFFFLIKISNEWLAFTLLASAVTEYHHSKCLEKI